MNKPPFHDQIEERRRKHTLAISLTTAVVFLLLTVILGPSAYLEDGLSGLWGVSLTGAASLAGFISAAQILRGQVTAGGRTLIVTILILSCALPFLAHGQGLALGAMVFVIVAAIANAAFSPRLASRAIIAAFLVAVIIAVADLYLPASGLPTTPAYTNVIAILTVLGYAFFIFRNFPTYALRTKIIIAFILITVVPLGILSVINSAYTTRAIQTQSEAELSRLAAVAAEAAENFIRNQLDNVNTDSKQTPFLDYLEEPAYLDDEKNASRALIALTRKNPIFIRSAAILNSNGVNILDTLESDKGRDESAFPYFSRPMKNGLPFVSNLIFRGHTPSIYFSAPIKNLNGKTIGILRVEYHAAIFQSAIQRLAQENPAASIALVDITTYLRIADSGSRENLFKTYKDFNQNELAAMQLDGRLPLDPLRGASEQVVNGVNNLEQAPIFYLYAEDNAAAKVFAGKILNARPWAALVSQPTEIYRAAAREQQRTNFMISIALVVLSVGTGFFLSKILTSSLTALTLTAEKVAAGDLDTQAQVKTEDEIGALAAAFNRMTFQLKQTLGGLEQRIAERTADLEISRQQSLKRANELQAISEISKTIASEQKLEILLPLITRLVSERFGFYHTGIFLLDNTKQFAVLQAASSPGGRKMLARGHKLEVGGNSIVGYVVSRGAPRISLDVGQDAVYFNNPDLPTTHSEMTLPLKVRDQIVGALDVQSEKPGAFTQSDADTLSILADQVAISIENARLFAQTQQALNEVQTLYRQNIQEGWRLFSREREFLGYRQSQAGGKKLKKIFENDEIRQAVNRGEALIFHADGVTQEASIVAPIKLRGQTIGSISIKAPVMRRPWSNDEMNLVETISERLSIALENARLIQESRLQAVKQQKISEVTGKIGESINLKSVLQTAVEELGRALPGSEVTLQIKSEEK